MSRRKATAQVARITKDGGYYYPWLSKETLEVEFTKTNVHCHLPDGTVLKKIKGGSSGGNYADPDGDVYRVSK